MARADEGADRAKLQVKLAGAVALAPCHLHGGAACGAPLRARVRHRRAGRHPLRDGDVHGGCRGPLVQAAEVRRGWKRKMQQLANVIDHLVRHEAFRIGPVVITTTVVNTWIIMAVLFAAVYLLTRRLDEKPKGAQALLEVIIEFYYSLIDTGMGQSRPQVPAHRRLALHVYRRAQPLLVHSQSTWCRPPRT